MSRALKRIAAGTSAKEEPDGVTKAMAVLTMCACLAFCRLGADENPEGAGEVIPSTNTNVGLSTSTRATSRTPRSISSRRLSLDTRFYLAYNAMGPGPFMKGRLDEAPILPQVPGDRTPKFTEARNTWDRLPGNEPLDKAEAEFRTALQD